MSNETDLDWLARNVHKWPAGDHQPWCYVYWKGGQRAVSGNCITIIQPCVRVEMSEWLSRRAVLQNKPSFADHPDAKCFVQNDSGTWFKNRNSTNVIPESDGGWLDRDMSCGWTQLGAGEVLGDWRDTLEKRPEQDEFETFASIEDSKEQEMKQDNEWFERGELPPVGVVCEAYLDLPPQWIEAEIVAHKDGFAIGWCKSVMKGCHGDKAREFRPVRTERDVLIEIIKKTDDTDGRIADAILAAGFKRGAA